jgi:hypothetical protein
VCRHASTLRRNCRQVSDRPILADPPFRLYFDDYTHSFLRSGPPSPRGTTALSTAQVAVDPPPVALMASHGHYESDNEDDLLSFGGPGPSSPQYAARQAYAQPTTPDPYSLRGQTPTYALDDGFNSADYGGGRSANQRGFSPRGDAYMDESES